MMLKIYTYPKSRSLRVLWTLEEMGIDYETVKVDLLTAEPRVKSPHLRGKVPFMTDGEVSIGETLAICIYLCEKHRDQALYPQSATEKVVVNSWLSFALTDLESPVWALLKQLVFTPAEQRSTELVNFLKGEADKAVATLRFDERQEWIASHHFTLADIFMSHTLQWAKYCGVELAPQIDNYINRAMSRPAQVRAQERNNR